MAITPQGGTTGTNLEVESGTRALRSIPHGNDWQCYGTYSAGATLPYSTIGGVTGSLAQFRLPNMAPNHVAAIRRFTITINNAAFVSAFTFVFQLFVVRNATVNGTGGAQLSTLNNNSKLRTNMGGQTEVAQGGDLRFVNSNAALVQMTGTVDTMPIASATIPSGFSLSNTQLSPIVYLLDVRAGEYPLILGPNEGLSFNITNTPSSGWNLAINIVYDELVAY